MYSEKNGSFYTAMRNGLIVGLISFGISIILTSFRKGMQGLSEGLRKGWYTGAIAATATALASYIQHLFKKQSGYAD